MPKLKFSNALVADFVAPGHANKYTVVNCYSGDIVVSEMPAALRLGLYIEFAVQKNQGKDLTLKISLGDATIAVIEAELHINAVGQPAVIAIPGLAFKFERNTNLKVVATSSGFSATTILDKQIYQGVLPTQ